MAKKKAVVIGNFSLGQSSFNGQTAKTRDYHYYLSKRFGEKQVGLIDTFNWKKHKIRNVFKLLGACIKYKNLVLLLGINSARTIVPIIVFLKKIFRFKIIFPVVGGGLMFEFDNCPRLQKSFKKIEAIYFETKMMANYFRGLGYENVGYAPVFTKRTYSGSTQVEVPQLPLKFCTYSRVCREKGISVAIDAVRTINERFGKVVCTLDIFGEPYEDYKDEFNQKLSQCEGFVESKPYLQGDGVIDILSQYALMLFPTYYEGEGFPIAIVECMLGGVPVIASDWHFNSEIVVNEETGYVYQLGNNDAFIDILVDLVNNPQKIQEMKIKCFENSRKFQPDLVLSEIYERIEKQKKDKSDK